jgi:hypothetical protein
MPRLFVLQFVAAGDYLVENYGNWQWWVMLSLIHLKLESNRCPCPNEHSASASLAACVKSDASATVVE